MRRRTLLASGFAGAFMARSARAQRSGRSVRLGYLSGSTSTEPTLGFFRHGLDRIGWIEGRDFVLAARFADFEYTRFPALTEDLLRTGIDILVVAGPAAYMIALAQRVVPVVFAFSGDPVEAGFVESLARPGGNATGICFLALELAGKRLDILREVHPAAHRVAVLTNPTHPGERSERQITSDAAERHGLTVVFLEVRERGAVAAALAATAPAGCDSLTCFPDQVTLASRNSIADHARRERLPSVFGWKAFCEAGGLVSYGPSQAEGYARLAYFVERIAGGARPGDLPVEVPRVIEMAVNLSTAAAIGTPVPQSLLIRADWVIE
jgi:putative ABC transport system substrate-binding protein